MTRIATKSRDLIGRLGAELAIVVLGVTIALWADGWVTNRSDRAEESARLYALLDNVEESLEDLDSARDNAAGAAEALRELASPESHGRNHDALVTHLRYGFFYVPTYHPELNVYDDLKNSGELALLSNAELRRALASMDRRLELLLAAQADRATRVELEDPVSWQDRCSTS